MNVLLSSGCLNNGADANSVFANMINLGVTLRGAAASHASCPGTAFLLVSMHRTAARGMRSLLLC